MHKDSFVITVGGSDYIIKPTMDSVRNIEAKFQLPLHVAAMKIESLRVSCLADFLSALLVGNGFVVSSEIVEDSILVDYKTKGQPVISVLLEVCSSFFPKVENDGTKKQTATEVTG